MYAALLTAAALTLLNADGVEGANYHRYDTPAITCVIGDNAALGQHRNRYNGVYSLTTPGLKDSPFVPSYAGLNLEHYFDLRPDINKDGHTFFEPRNEPMAFKQIDAYTSELYQPVTPYWGVESTTRFTVSPEGHIDMDFTCTPHKDHWVGGFMGIFWASYINAPINKSIYFLQAGSSLDKPRWLQYCTQRHGLNSTVLGPDDAPFSEGGESTTNLFASVSPLRYALPFYYGRFRDQVLIFLYEADEGGRIRLTQSP
ncbi:MAG: hypothetical protein L3K26_11405, partial [Candidatus Hydrogenedentes bacterium]|nr:hypothetical protein [Candidatus Hydrogenedentota bacterium]